MKKEVQVQVLYYFSARHSNIKRTFIIYYMKIEYMPKRSVISWVPLLRGMYLYFEFII